MYHGKRDSAPWAAHTQARLKDQLAAADRKHESVMRAIENGAWNDSILKRLNELEAQQATLREQLQAAANPDPVVRLHPAALYAAKVTDLQAALNHPDIRVEAMEALQTLIERIVLTPNENAPHKLAIELHGDLETILNLASAAATQLGKSAGSADKIPPPQTPELAPEQRHDNLSTRPKRRRSGGRLHRNSHTATNPNQTPKKTHQAKTTLRNAG